MLYNINAVFEAAYIEVWLSLVERCVRDAEAVGSSPVTSTNYTKIPFSYMKRVFLYFNVKYCIYFLLYPNLQEHCTFFHHDSRLSI